MAHVCAQFEGQTAGVALAPVAVAPVAVAAVAVAAIVGLTTCTFVTLALQQS